MNILLWISNERFSTEIFKARGETEEGSERGKGQTIKYLGSHNPPEKDFH